MNKAICLLVFCVGCGGTVGTIEDDASLPDASDASTSLCCLPGDQDGQGYTAYACDVGDSIPWACAASMETEDGYTCNDPRCMVGMVCSAPFGYGKVGVCP
jgi:hypothetical protein